MDFVSVSQNQTPTINPNTTQNMVSVSSSSDPPTTPSMMTMGTFYLNPPTHIHQQKFPLTSSQRWTMNHPNNSGLNPVLQFGSAPSWAIKDILNSSSSSNREENNNDKTNLKGLVPSKPVFGAGMVDVTGKPIKLAINDADVEMESEKLNESDKNKGKKVEGASKSKTFIGMLGKGNFFDQNSDADDEDGDRGGEDEEEENTEAEILVKHEERNFSFVKTWNLRPRKPLTKPQNLVGTNNGRGGELRNGPSMSKPRPPTSRTRPPCVATPDNKATTVMAPELKKSRFSVSLTKEEIEEDFIQLTGAKPPKKLKKRPKLVRKQLDGCFPGMYLASATLEHFKVPKPPL